METFPCRIKIIQREAALTRGLKQGGKELKARRVRVRKQMGLHFS
jgi:hypothetical protein